MSSSSLWSSWWLPLTPLLHPSLEYHSDPLGASDRDLYHPDGVFGTLLCCLRFIPGPALLPSQEENQRLWQCGEILRFLKHTLCFFKNKNPY